MYYRCELLIGGYVYPITDDIKNWEDITVSFKRNDYDGVVRTFSDDFEFIRGSRKLLLNEYYNNYLNASANIVIYTRNNSWKWTERFRCALNFSTLKDDGYTTTMNAIDNSVASVLKAKKGTEYEYSVNDVKESVPLYYDRMEMDSLVRWVDGATIDEELGIKIISFPAGSARSTMGLPMYITSNEIAVKNKIEVQDVSDFEYKEDVSYFLKALDEQVIHLKINLYLGNMSIGLNDSPVVYLRKYRGTSVSQLAVKTLSGTDVHTFSYDGEITLAKGDLLKLLIENASGEAFELFIGDSVTFDVSFKARESAVMLDVVKPQELLNRLLNSMNGGNDGLTGIIVPSGEKRLDNALILAAESARKMPGAKIHTSFAKFCDWMKYVFGYVYDIEGNTITFRHRDDYFSDNVVKTIENYTGYSMSLNSSLIYSQVRIGYEKKDYNSVNGKDEFRFTNEYTTGITLTDNKLEMISPYRADAYGIEFLAQTIGEDTTDNESDTDLFFVCAASDGEKYILDRSVPIEGVISPETMFNAMYAPSTFIFSNFSFLGSFISKMTFASSNGNSFVKTALNSENRNVEINKNLFSVAQVEIETSDIDLPKDLTGIVELNHQGRTIKGYYVSADYHYTKTKSSKITLVVK